MLITALVMLRQLIKTIYVLYVIKGKKKEDGKTHRNTYKKIIYLIGDQKNGAPGKVS